MSHTPGPWVYVKDNPDKIINTRGKDVIVGSCYGDINISDADAQLITTAPDLLYALKKVRDALIRYVGPEVSLYEITEANAAIAKAEGRDYPSN